LRYHIERGTRRYFTERRELWIPAAGFVILGLTSITTYAVTLQNRQTEKDLAAQIQPLESASPQKIAKEPKESPKEPVDQPASWSVNFAEYSTAQLGQIFNFDIGTLVPSYNDEAQYHTDRPKNVRVENGKLVIEAHREKYGSGANQRDYTSGRVNTKGKFDFKYGTINVRAKLPRGVGTWPAIWMLSTDEKYTQGATDAQWESDENLYAKDGEIDIMEAVGHDPGVIFPDVHTYYDFSHGVDVSPEVTPITRPDIYDVFHDYGLIWTPDSLTFTFDGEPYSKVTKKSDDPDRWPFDQKFHLILNLAMGGSWGGEQKDKYPPDGINPNPGSWQFEIESITYQAS
jgi:hypothetical protein